MRSFRIRCSGTLTPKEAILDRFWRYRGVLHAEQRRRLINASKSVDPGDGIGAFDLRPGLAYVWSLDRLRPEVCWISQSVLALHGALGGSSEIDVAWMCCQEPSLLKLPVSHVMHQLMDMKLSASGSTTDVLKVVERQPRLLLTSSNVNPTESPVDALAAWEHGLMTDNDTEWNCRYTELQQFCDAFGHSHMGCVLSDGEQMTAWVTKQRSDFQSGRLSKHRETLLSLLGFEFDPEEAVWLRWFHEWSKGGQSLLLTPGEKSYLTHWCSVQRIAQRSNQLLSHRLELLESAGFELAVPDPLS